MYAAPGIGLAATQVDVHEQVIVIDVSETHDQLQVLINPEILESRGEAECEEGCLSVPGVYEKVVRAEWIKVRALDVQDGQPFTLEADGLLGGVHPARNGPPQGQGVRRVSVAPEADAYRGQAEEAAAPGDVMRLVFAGTPAFARVALQALLDAGHDVALVLTQPDRPAGRGLKLRPSEVKALALERGLAACATRQFEAPRRRCSRCATARAQALVVAAYGLILPQAVLDLFTLGCINIHASLLPRWRGAAPIQRAILAGDTRHRHQHHAHGRRASTPARSTWPRRFRLPSAILH